MLKLSKNIFIFLVVSSITFVSSTVFAIDPAVQAKIDAKKIEIANWGKDPVLVQAVKNASQVTMTQAEWDALTVIDPKIIGFTGSPAGSFLKSKKSDWLTEAFVSRADGTKVGFLSKPSGWSHAGKPKHDKPMAGETWQGEVELDESTGKEQVQVAAPVVDGSTVVGSIVVGIDLGKL